MHISWKILLQKSAEVSLKTFEGIPADQDELKTGCVETVCALLVIPLSSLDLTATALFHLSSCGPPSPPLDNI